jgi:hypothetical protein
MSDIITYSQIVIGIIGTVFGFIFRIIWERQFNRIIKYDELVLNDEINNIKDKLDIYWSIYFKLLICLSAKLQIKKIKLKSINLTNMIAMENEIIIKNLEEIILIITKNIQKMDITDDLLDMILRFISHVLAYKCLRQLNINTNNPSEYGFPFPDDFTQEITRRTLLYKSMYDKYLRNENINLNENLQKNNNLTLEFKQKLNNIYVKQSSKAQNILNDNDFLSDDEDLDFDNIQLNAIFQQSSSDKCIINIQSMEELPEETLNLKYDTYNEFDKY